jgi:hypothetical protein
MGTPHEREVSATEFERLGGRGATKKWRQSIRLVNPDGEQHQQQRAKCNSALHTVFPNSCTAFRCLALTDVIGYVYVCLQQATAPGLFLHASSCARNSQPTQLLARLSV